MSFYWGTGIEDVYCTWQTLRSSLVGLCKWNLKVKLLGDLHFAKKRSSVCYIYINQITKLKHGATKVQVSEHV